MGNSVLTSTGEVTIPKSILESIGAKEGDAVTFTPLPNGTILIRIKTRSFKELGGLFYEEGREAVPIEKLSF